MVDNENKPVSKPAPKPAPTPKTSPKKDDQKIKKTWAEQPDTL